MPPAWEMRCAACDELFATFERVVLLQPGQPVRVVSQAADEESPHEGLVLHLRCYDARLLAGLSWPARVPARLQGSVL